MPHQPPVHPGEIIREEYLKPLDMSVYALAKALDVPQTRMAEIVNEKRSISADTAIRLGRYFKTSAEMWMNLQAHYDVEMIRDSQGPALTADIRPYRAVAKPARTMAATLTKASAKRIGSTGGFTTAGRRAPQKATPKKQA